MITIVVDDVEDDGERADVVLGRRVPGLSRRIARAIALRGKLRVAGHAAPPSTRVALGDRLELMVDREPAVEPARLLAVTESFIYADKPANVHTHRLRPDDVETLADRVALVHPECAMASPDVREGGALHRLDHETTGVVAFARSPEAWAQGRAAIKHAHKLYLAICSDGQWPPAVATPAPDEPVPQLAADLPQPQPGTAVRVAAPIARGASPDRVAVVDATLGLEDVGQDAVTTIWPLGRGEGRLFCALSLFGGRRHQLRAHLSWAGLPILGDARYGAGAGAELLLLHAYLLDLSHACAGESPVIAPLPAHLRAAWLPTVVSSR